MADKYYGINSKVIYKAVSSEFGEEINEKERVPRSFICVGSDFGGKGINYILKAAEKYPDCNFTIVGLNKQINEEMKRAQMKGLFDNVNFLGVVSKKEIRSLYRSNRFFYFLLSEKRLGFHSWKR